MTWRILRDRLLGDPAVRRRVMRLPLGRRIAAHHTTRLFGIVAGFVESQLLLAALDLGVFDALAAGPRPWPAGIDLPPRGAAALLQGLVAAGLVERRGAAVALTIDGLVVASDPGLRLMIDHDRRLYADLADPAALLRGEGAGAVARLWPYAGSAGEPATYTALMAASQPMIADAVLSSVRWSRLRHVVDVGGGDGRFLRTLRAHRPRLALTLADLPPVVAGLDLSGERIAVASVTAGGALPPGADAMTLLRLLHDLDDDAAAALLGRVAQALPRGGTVVVAEPMAAVGRDPQTAYFAAYFAAMRSGRLRTPAEVTRLLAAAGFAQPRIRRPAPLATVVIGRRV